MMNYKRVYNTHIFLSTTELYLFDQIFFFYFSSTKLLLFLIKFSFYLFFFIFSFSLRTIKSLLRDQIFVIYTRKKQKNVQLKSKTANEGQVWKKIIKREIIFQHTWSQNVIYNMYMHFHGINIEREKKRGQHSIARQGQVCFGVHKDNNLWQQK